ncbi:MAG: septum formation initiator family protein [Ginsengibacter sp.]
MKKFLYIFRNKYLITGIAFASWMMFFDSNDIQLQMKRMKELRKLKQGEINMTSQIINAKKELKSLKTDPFTLEKYARERFLMKKDNEDLYLVTFDSSGIR